MSTGRGQDMGNGPVWGRRGTLLARIAAAARVLTSTTSFPPAVTSLLKMLFPRRGSLQYATWGAIVSCAAAVLSSGDGRVRGSAPQLCGICEIDVSSASLLLGASTNLRTSCRFPRANHTRALAEGR